MAPEIAPFLSWRKNISFLFIGKVKWAPEIANGLTCQCIEPLDYPFVVPAAGELTMEAKKAIVNAKNEHKPNLFF